MESRWECSDRSRSFALWRVAEALFLKRQAEGLSQFLTNYRRTTDIREVEEFFGA
jgi:hypothetical protein